MDPVCGKAVDPASAASVRRGVEVVYFCSDVCRREYLRRAAAIIPSRMERNVAYFSMEIALDSNVPTYAGGLGVLAGDTLRSCADLRVPIVGVTLVHRHGYFEQALSASGQQQERPATWKPEDVLSPLEQTAQVEIGGRAVQVRAWKQIITGGGGFTVPVLFLDTDLPANSPADRRLTDSLYGGDQAYRLAQEIVLGVGGMRLLRACGYEGVRVFHLNEGHAAFAAAELLRETNLERDRGWDFESVRERCVFTTHTPVAAGHDVFDKELVRKTLGDLIPFEVLGRLAGGDRVDMSELALNLSGYVNGVARRHREVSEKIYPGRAINHITNGVHSGTWVCDSLAAVFDRYIPGWKDDPALLRKAEGIPAHELWEAHLLAKARLFDTVKTLTGRVLSPKVLTVGFARRSAAYKRGDLVFHDLARLRSLGRGQLQFVFAGKAHPHDGEGKALIAHIIALGAELGDEVPVVYLPNYDLDLAKQVVSGVDLWLNTPRRPLEASGTSGMKAAHNGVPSLSVLDGWWLEGYIENVTGWAIGADLPAAGAREEDEADAADLYSKLEQVVLPTFRARERWLPLMQHSIAVNASYFNSHRTVWEYVSSAYLR